MFTIKPLPEFLQWLITLPDSELRAIIAARIKRLERGLLGDVKPVGNGVSELRIHIGAGWRIYFTRSGKHIIVLLAGGSKRTQKQDISRAKALAALIVPLTSDEDNSDESPHD